MELAKLLRLLPLDQHVVFRVERNDEGESFLSMVHFKDAPDDGWKVDGERFGEASGTWRHSLPCPEHSRFDNRCIYGVSGKIGEEKEFMAACVEALQKYIAKLKVQQ